MYRRRGFGKQGCMGVPPPVFVCPASLRDAHGGGKPPNYHQPPAIHARCGRLQPDFRQKYEQQSARCQSAPGATIRLSPRSARFRRRRIEFPGCKSQQPCPDFFVRHTTWIGFGNRDRRRQQPGLGFGLVVLDELCGVDHGRICSASAPGGVARAGVRAGQDAALASTRCTCTACQAPPRAVWNPRRFNSAAMPHKLVVPVARISAPTN